MIQNPYTKELLTLDEAIEAASTLLLQVLIDKKRQKEEVARHTG